MQISRKLVLLGSILGILSVAIGAFGAHALKSVLDANGFRPVFETGVQYQMAHSLALLILAALCDSVIPARKLMPIGALFTVGVVMFSGSLYALAITGVHLFGAITPLGGLAFLAGWALLIVAAASKKGSE